MCVCKFFGVFFIGNHVDCEQRQFYFFLHNLYILFPFLSAIARTAVMMLTRREGRGHPCLIPNPRKCLISFFIVDTITDVPIPPCLCPLPPAPAPTSLAFTTVLSVSVGHMWMSTG